MPTPPPCHFFTFLVLKPTIQQNPLYKKWSIASHPAATKRHKASSLHHSLPYQKGPTLAA